MYALVFLLRVFPWFWAFLAALPITESVLQFPIDLDQYDRREQLKKSGLGKVRIHYLIQIDKNRYVGFILRNLNLFWLWQVIMFLSKSDEETNSNRRLAKDLVDKWVIIFFKSSNPSNQIPASYLLYTWWCSLVQFSTRVLGLRTWEISMKIGFPIEDHQWRSISRNLYFFYFTRFHISYTDS
jgi:hypothetical protein